jgi:uncharacterized membrane protein
MTNLAFSIMFTASAPIALLPSALALFTRQRRSTVILPVNLLAWAGLYYLLHQVVVNGSNSSSLAMPIPVVLVTWLVLFRFAVRDGRASSPSETV